MAVFGICMLRLKSLPIACPKFPTWGGFCCQKHRQHGSSLRQGLISQTLFEIHIHMYSKKLHKQKAVNQNYKCMVLIDILLKQFCL